MPRSLVRFLVSFSACALAMIVFTMVPGLLGEAEFVGGTEDLVYVTVLSFCLACVIAFGLPE